MADYLLSDQLKEIRAPLATWVEQKGGDIVIAASMSQLYQIAWNTTKGPKLILVYMGEEPRGNWRESSLLRRVDRKFTLGIVRSKGFTSDKSASLVEDVQDNEPFLDLVEEAKNIVACTMLNSDVTERPIDMGPTRPLPQFQNWIMDGYLFEFSVGTQLAIPTEVTGG